MTTQNLEKFHILGVALRTTNENRQAEQDIPALWGKFIGEGILQNIPNKIDDTIYCMYTDYESDYTKAYTTIIGCKVANLDTIPEGMTGKTVEAGTYAKFVAKGNIMEGAVQEAWEDIWKADIQRAYIADFDVYGAGAQNPEDAEVEIFVSLVA